MKVVACFQFYLPYLLPRHTDWKGKSLNLTTPPFRISVTPRDSDEPVLAKNDGFSMSMKIVTSSVADSHSRKATTPEDSCCDRLQVAVEGDIERIEMTREDQTRGRFAEAAIESANIFIEHCRVLARQPDMTGLRREVVSGKIEGSQFPYSLWWYDPAAKKWLHGMSAGGAISVLLHNAISWETILKQIEVSINPPLQRALLLDARQRFAREQLREAILAAATAIEVASNLYIDALGADGRPDVMKLLDARKPFAEKRFNSVTQLLSNRSLKTEDAALYELVLRLYRVRNDIAHHGVLVEDEVIVDRTSAIRVVKEFLDAADRAVAWLGELHPKASAS